MTCVLQVWIKGRELGLRPWILVGRSQLLGRKNTLWMAWVRVTPFLWLSVKINLEGRPLVYISGEVGSLRKKIKNNGGFWEILTDLPFKNAVLKIVQDNQKIYVSKHQIKLAWIWNLVSCTDILWFYTIKDWIYDYLYI
jgi:hypothetical protein